ncbi:Organic cation/carnitine transporter1, putative [Theobroma cacao]|uniref:Organic cation/carnitine transporter1, putative n=1 Tax=Theobroma cacao TaxID=3641 RepID=A0A061FVD8_THECC|nr:Organic cation/carnitine transporter1, putative [Theobroma cacao]
MASEGERDVTANDKNENLWTVKWAAKRMIMIMIPVVLNALMEIPAVFVGCVLLNFITNGQSKGDGSDGCWPQLTIKAIGFMVASVVFDVLYIYCVKLFPTNAFSILNGILSLWLPETRNSPLYETLEQQEKE